MLKKVILGIIVSAVVLTTGVGGIYAYQKNSNPSDEVAIAGSKSYKTYSTNSNFTGNKNKQYRLQQNECSQLNCPNEDCENQDCVNENYTEQYCSRENNCYRYNNDENGYQNHNNFCYRNSTKNQNCNENCENYLQNSKDKTFGKNIKNNFGKNK
mgnify:CR=1 FL=1